MAFQNSGPLPRHERKPRPPSTNELLDLIDDDCDEIERVDLPANASWFDPTCSPGSIIDSYEILDWLGQGGMSVVFRAVDLATGGEVALKLPRFGMPETFIDNEVTALEAIRGAGCIELLAHGRRLWDHRRYLVTKIARGLPIAAYYDCGIAKLSAALTLVGNIAEALANVHDSRFSHGDVTGQNVFVHWTGTEPQVELIDFGLARALDHETRADRSTIVRGTPEYLAPERLYGAPTSPTADVYALGIILYRLVAGDYPYLANNVVELARAHRHQPIPRVGFEVPGAEVINDLLCRTLAVSPSDRMSDSRLAADYFRRAALAEPNTWLIRSDSAPEREGFH